MIDIFKIGGKIELDGVDKANSKLSSLATTAGKVATKIGKGFATIAKATGVVVTAVGAGVAAIGKKSLDAYADYEQLVGGVETLFGKSADAIKKYAAQAYETAGISANEYMEQATSFSASLLQSLGGDTAAAAEIADMAIRDMADNANKMGTAIESIQNAYQGFAKQNFTMLDNLKLGYGGTKEEMERLLKDAEALTGKKYDISNLADIYDAIHAVQEEMGITGTTALEASTTISGSIGTMKSAWQNMLAGFADENADMGQLAEKFAQSVLTVADNIVPKILTILPNLVTALGTLIEKLLPKLPPLIKQILPTLVKGAISLVQGIVAALPEIISALMDCLPALIDGILALVAGIVEALPVVLPQLIDGILALIDGIIQALPQMMETLCAALPTLIPQLLDGILKAIIELCNNFGAIIQPIIDMLPELITNIVDTLIENLPALIDGVISLVLGIVGAIDQIIEKIVPMIPEIIIAVVGAIIENIPRILAGIGEVIEAILGVVDTLVESICDILGQGWNWLADNVLAPIGDWIYDNVIAPVVNFFKGLWESVSGFFINLWDDITGIFKSAANWFKEKVTDPIANFFKKMGETIKDIWNGIWAAIKKAINGIIGGINGFIRGICSGINFVIRAMNKISFEIPDWVPIVGGKTFGFNIGEINAPQIPLLRKGGVLERGQMGFLEGTGAEAVVPLHENRKWIRAVAEDMNDALGNSNAKIEALLEDILELLRMIAGKEIILDTGALVGGLAEPIDVRLGKIRAQKARA